MDSKTRKALHMAPRALLEDYQPLEESKPKEGWPNFDLGFEGIDVQIMNKSQLQNEEEAIRLMADFSLGTWDTFTDGIDNQGCKSIVGGLKGPGQQLSQGMECVNAVFYIKGISRACSHQIVRTRIGAGFNQKVGRDLSWEKDRCRVPVTVAADPALTELFQASARRDWKVYHTALNNGIPFEDARFCMPHGVETSLRAYYSFLALVGFCNNRMCDNMAWEINYVSKLMKYRLLEIAPWLGEYLKPRCERIGRCTYDGENFEPCGKRGDKIIKDPNDLTLMPTRNEVLYEYILTQASPFVQEVCFIDWPEKALDSLKAKIADAQARR